MRPWYSFSFTEQAMRQHLLVTHYKLGNKLHNQHANLQYVANMRLCYGARSAYVCVCAQPQDPDICNFATSCHLFAKCACVLALLPGMCHE